MRISTAAGVAAALSLFGLDAAAAASFPQNGEAEQARHFAPSYGKTLPPVGFVRFCVRNPADCRPSGWSPRRAFLSADRWRQVYQLNSYVNARIKPVSDAELYGAEEHWDYPSDAGDCEDYVLMKKRYLEKLGIARSALLITVVLDERNEGHAVLTLRTEDGDFVLDNRRNEIRRWSETDYAFLKRQSARDPREWVSLSQEGVTVSAVTAGGAGAPEDP
ncbi:MAG: transglutaminase-like cysteine peptidase [Aestuariivirga sp.]|nr:transglutaminase-like cysteine peptidase [Aestuariivirga sp.]